MLHVFKTDTGDIVLTDNPDRSKAKVVIFSPRNDAFNLAHAILQLLEHRTPAGIITNPTEITAPLPSPTQFKLR